MVVINEVVRCVGEGWNCRGDSSHAVDAHQRGTSSALEVIHINDGAGDESKAEQNPGQFLGLAAVVVIRLAKMVSRVVYLERSRVRMRPRNRVFAMAEGQEGQVLCENFGILAYECVEKDGRLSIRVGIVVVPQKIKGETVALRKILMEVRNELTMNHRALMWRVGLVSS